MPDSPLDEVAAHVSGMDLFYARYRSEPENAPADVFEELIVAQRAHREAVIKRAAKRKAKKDGQV